MKILEDLVHTGVVDGVVSKRSGVDERGGVVDGVVGDRGSVDEGSGVVDEGLVGAGDAFVLYIGVVLGIMRFWFQGER